MWNIYNFEISSLKNIRNQSSIEQTEQIQF